MASEGILLRQTHHAQSVISQMNEKAFAESFGNIRLVFEDGELWYYKAVLVRLYPSWGQIFEDSGSQADVVILKEWKKEEFIWQVMKEQNKDCLIKDIKTEGEAVKDDNLNKDDIDHSTINDSTASKETLSDTIEIFTNSEYNSQTDDLKIYSEVTEALGGTNTENVELEGNVVGKDVLSIASDFSWPSYFATVPNYHSVQWGAKSGSVVEVMGNMSIFTVLAQKYRAFPDQTAFVMKTSEDSESDGETEDRSGIFSLRDFVNSGVDKTVAAFVVDGSEEKFSLVEILKSLGYKEGNQIAEYYISIFILLEGKFENLKDMTKVWKDDLIAATIGKELIRYSRVDKKVMDWMQTEAKKTTDGGEICCYCGLVCYEQSLSGNFRAHMKKHLYRKVFCFKCRNSTTAAKEHICSKKDTPRVKSVPCTECGGVFYSRSDLVRHLKSRHHIIDKLVILKECLFCSKKVANLSAHYTESHRNEELGCHLCDKTFANPNKLKTHISSFHTRAYSGYCQLCQREYKNLNKHNSQAHNDRNSYACDHCEKVFKHAKSLEAHMQSVNGTREKEPCPECGNLYVNVKGHITTFHRGVKKNKNVKYCLGCKKSFPKENFADHKKVCHSESICHICSISVMGIRQHMARKHQLCDRRCCLCQHDFHTAEDLNNHLRAEHFPQLMTEPEFIGINLYEEDKIQREEIARKFVSQFAKKPEEGKLECKFCKFQTMTAIYMITHMKEHLGFTFRKGKKSKS